MGQMPAFVENTPSIRDKIVAAAKKQVALAQRPISQELRNRSVCQEQKQSGNRVYHCHRCREVVGSFVQCAKNRTGHVWCEKCVISVLGFSFQGLRDDPSRWKCNACLGLCKGACIGCMEDNASHDSTLSTKPITTHINSLHIRRYPFQSALLSKDQTASDSSCSLCLTASPAEPSVDYIDNCVSSETYPSASPSRKRQKITKSRSVEVTKTRSVQAKFSPTRRCSELDLSSYLDFSKPLHHTYRMDLGITFEPTDVHWCYIDESGKEQGPFPNLLMMQWYDKKYLPEDLPVRRTDESKFKAIRKRWHCDFITSRPHSAPPNTSASPSTLRIPTPNLPLNPLQTTPLSPLFPSLHSMLGEDVDSSGSSCLTPKLAIHLNKRTFVQ